MQLWQHCNRLYTGACMCCGGIPAAIACDRCHEEIGEYDVFHKAKDGSCYCEDCHAALEEDE